MSSAEPNFTDGPARDQEREAAEWLGRHTFCVLGSPENPAPSSNNLPPRTSYLETSLQVLEFVERHPGAFVFLTPGAVSEPDLEVFSRICQIDSQAHLIPVAQWEEVAKALNLARRLGLGHVLPFESLGESVDAARWLKIIVRGPGDGSAENDPDTSEWLGCLDIRTRNDRRGAAEEIINSFAKERATEAFAYTLRLSLEEALNNAIFHGFRTPQGEEKYSIDGFESLEPSESVRITYGSEGEQAYLKVDDNAGSLTRDVVLKSIERHSDQESIFDHAHDKRGRGLFLLYSMSKAMMLTLKPGSLTRIKVILDLSETPGPVRPVAKPIFIFD